MSEIELETASDDWFVDANVDGVPEFAIGRLPVRTAAQAATVVGKITGYDAEPGGAWAKGVALVTDTDDPTVRFRASSAGVETRVPSGYQVSKPRSRCDRRRARCAASCSASSTRVS